MTSIFSNNRILPNLKRRPRTTTSRADVSPAKAKPLHILPNLAEEDECRRSLRLESPPSSSTSSFYGSRSVGGSATLGCRLSTDVLDIKRISRRVVLTGAEGLTFDDFFPMSSAPTPPRPAPAPPLFGPATSCESPLDDINLRFSGLGISLDFPSPPAHDPTRTSSIRRREQSPTPSVASSFTSSTTSSASSSSSKRTCPTPPTSDDESHSHSRLTRSPTCKSHRASIVFMASTPDLSQTPSNDADSTTKSIEEDAAWFAQDISDVVTLSTPLPSTFPLSPLTSPSSPDLRARPDSLPPPPRRNAASGKSRHSKPLPVVPGLSIQIHPPHGPSVQLDPTFPQKKRCYPVPKRPPPPPPIPDTPISSMEAATEQLLAELANAALQAGFLGTGLSAESDGFSSAGSAPATPSSQFIVTTPSCARPPPRMSIPADINDLSDDAVPAANDVGVGIEVELAGELEPGANMWPTTPQSISVYSQMSAVNASFPPSPLSAFEFDAFVDHSQDGHSLPDAEDIIIPDSPTLRLRDPAAAERALRSRWSSSTLASLAERQPHSGSSWIPRFTLSPSKKNKSKPKVKHVATSGPSLLSLRSPLPLSPVAKRSFDLDIGLDRRDSRSSRTSDCGASDSGESTASSGLRRKPIPVEIFMRS